MKKALLGLFGLLVLLTGLVFIWLQFPTRKHPTVIREALDQARQRHDHLQKLASDEQENAYTVPMLRDYWNPANRGSVDDPVYLVLEKWNRYSSLEQGRVLDHQALQTSEEYRQARAEFEALVPLLRDAVSRPLLVHPDPSPLMLTTETINRYNLSRLCDALVALAESERVRGHTEPALRHLKTALTLADRSLGIGGVAGTISSVQLKRRCAQALAGLYPPGSGLSAPQWQELSDHLLSLDFRRELAEEMLQTELLVANNSFTEARKKRSVRQNLTGGGAVFHLSGVLEREQRLYENFMSESLLALRADPPSSFPQLPQQLTVQDYLAGRAGLLSDSILVDLTRVVGVIDFSRQYVRGLAAATRLLAQPEAELGPEFEDMTWSPETFELSVPVRGVDRWTLNAFHQEPFSDAKWVTLENDGLRFNLVR